MEPEVLLRSRPMPAEERLADVVIPVPRSVLEGIRRLIEVHDGFEGARLCEARRRLRLLLEMEP